MNVALFTDEESIIQFFKYLLAKVPFSIYPIESLNSSICKSYSYVIVGATQIYEEDTKKLGRDTWYHPEQLWVQSDGVKRDLTEKQAKLLQYFLDHEGEVVTKYELADYIWGGYIKPEGIPKFIARLKDKLGPA